MSLILSIETSTSVCSAALHQDGALLTSLEYHLPQSTASKLALIVEQLFKLSDTQPAQLNAVAVSAGPGSYTGLRIGVATAKGLCYALNIPLIAVNTLELMAHQVASSFPIGQTQENTPLLVPMLDARRMEVYTLVVDSSLQIISPTEAKIIDELSYHSLLEEKKLIFFGNGAAKCKPVITHLNANYIDNIIPSAATLGSIAFTKLANHEWEDLESYEPYYLKDFMVKKPKALL